MLKASLVEWLGVQSRGHQRLSPTVSFWGEAAPCWEVWGPVRGTTQSPHLMGHLCPAHCPLSTHSDLGISSISASGLGLQSPQWEAGSLPVQLVALKTSSAKEEMAFRSQRQLRGGGSFQFSPKKGLVTGLIICYGLNCVVPPIPPVHLLKPQHSM